MIKLTLVILAALLSLPAHGHEGHHHGEHSPGAKQKTAQGPQATAFAEIQRDYLKAVKPIFDRKCAACHSLDSPAPWYSRVPLVGWIVNSDRSEAKEHLEISKGFPFGGHGTPEEDLQAIGEEVDKGEMPTFLYRAMHPSSKLTEQEKTSILEWVKASQKKLVTIGR